MQEVSGTPCLWWIRQRKYTGLPFLLPRGSDGGRQGAQLLRAACDRGTKLRGGRDVRLVCSDHSSAWHTACTERGVTQPVTERWSASASTRQKGVLAINQGALKDALQLRLLKFLLCYRPHRNVLVEATWVKLATLPLF